MQNPPDKGPRFIREVIFERERFDSDELASRDAYLRRLPLVKHLDRLTFSDVTFIVGENGTGKSTLIEAIAVLCGFNPEGGSRNFNFATRGSHSALHDYLKLVKAPSRPRDGYFLRAESLYNVATELERLDGIPAVAPPLTDAYGGRSLHEMSHGESFFAIMCGRFFGNGLYILDEPEAALSPSRVMAMLTLIHDLTVRGSQFIISTHSPILLAYPNATIYELSPDAIAQPDYRETATYSVMKRFLDSPEQMAHYLTEG